MSSIARGAGTQVWSQNQDFSGGREPGELLAA